MKIPVANHANNRDKIFTIFMDHHINKFHNPTALLESEEGNAADDGVRLAELPLVRRIERIVFARSLCDGPLRRCDAIGVGFDRAGGEAGGGADAARAGRAVALMPALMTSMSSARLWDGKVHRCCECLHHCCACVMVQRH